MSNPDACDTGSTTTRPNAQRQHLYKGKSHFGRIGIDRGSRATPVVRTVLVPDHSKKSFSVGCGTKGFFRPDGSFGIWREEHRSLRGRIILLVMVVLYN
jgi:hypothetical protein